MNLIRASNGKVGRRLIRPAHAIAIVMATAALGACVVAPVRPYYGGAYVTAEPPPPRVEVIGVAPYPGYFWVGGYWGWSGGHHEWYPGRWEAPRPGYRYVPHAWEREGGGWRLHEGRWEDDRRR